MVAMRIASVGLSASLWLSIFSLSLSSMHTFLSSVIKQLGMMDYWAVENVGTLSKVGFLGFNPASFTKIATGGWFVALVAQVCVRASCLVHLFLCILTVQKDGDRKYDAEYTPLLCSWRRIVVLW